MITFLILWWFGGFLAWKFAVYLTLNYDRDPVTVQDMLVGVLLCAIFGPLMLLFIVLYFLFSGDYDIKWMKKEIYSVPSQPEDKKGK